MRLQIYTFGFAACKQELILNTPNSSKENDQENRPRDLRQDECRPRGAEEMIGSVHCLMIFYVIIDVLFGYYLYL